MCELCPPGELSTEPLVSLPCSHRFHETCLITYMEEHHGECPTCHTCYGCACPLAPLWPMCAACLQMMSIVAAKDMRVLLWFCFITHIFFFCESVQNIREYQLKSQLYVILFVLQALWIYSFNIHWPVILHVSCISNFVFNQYIYYITQAHYIYMFV